MRDLIKGADIALANFENPAPNRFSWHTQRDGLLGRPRAHRRRSSNAGIDYVSLANNHIRDAGDAGHPPDHREPQEARASRYSGAGKDLAAARKPAMLEAGGTKVAILGYDAIAKGYHATARTRPAARSCRQGRARPTSSGRAQGRRGHRHRLPALGHRVRPDAVRRPAAAGPR